MACGARSGLKPEMILNSMHIIIGEMACGARSGLKHTFGKSDGHP